MRVHLKTLGCRLNEAELETWAQGFQKAGHQITTDLNEANLVVFNSCAVTQEAERKSKQVLRRMYRDNPTAKLIVSGCFATLNPDQAAQSLGVDLVVSNKDKHSLVDMALNELDFNQMPAMSTQPGENVLFSRGRQRAFIKVQDGCRYRCTFCIVTEARGEENSRSISDIISEINHLHQEGINEIILTGVHLGGYGSDINSHLSELIGSVLNDTDIPRIRLGSLEPWDLPDNFYTLFENPRLMPHLHLPLQSGSDSVLRRMARRCKSTEFKHIAEQARLCIKDFNLTTDIIVGFPGETEQEWRESYDFIESTEFGHIHIFAYSPRIGTKAANMAGQLPKATKKSRSQSLHHLAETMKQSYRQQNLGKSFPILWESHKEKLENGHYRVFGYTPNYLRAACELETEQNLENQILIARLHKLDKDVLKVQLL